MTGAIPPDDRAVVVLESVWWKNPFLWMALGMGIPITILTMEDGVEHLAPGFGVATLVLAVLAHLSLRARLEIRPDGFREKLAFWRTIEHRWSDVGKFSVLKQDEAEDAVPFWLLENGRNTGKFDVLMGAYADSVEALTDRMNAAREKRSGPARRVYRAVTSPGDTSPRRSTRKRAQERRRAPAQPHLHPNPPVRHERDLERHRHRLPWRGRQPQPERAAPVPVTRSLARGPADRRGESSSDATSSVKHRDSGAGSAPGVRCREPVR